MAIPPKTGKKLNKEVKPVRSFTRSPNGEQRQVVYLRFSMEELDALETMAERFQLSFSETVREAVREKLAEEKILVS